MERRPCPRCGSTCARGEAEADESIPDPKGRESRTPRTFPCITACFGTAGRGHNRHHGHPRQAGRRDSPSRTPGKPTPDGGGEGHATVVAVLLASANKQSSPLLPPKGAGSRT